MQYVSHPGKQPENPEQNNGAAVDPSAAEKEEEPEPDPVPVPIPKEPQPEQEIEPEVEPSGPAEIPPFNPEERRDEILRIIGSINDPALDYDAIHLEVQNLLIMKDILGAEGYLSLIKCLVLYLDVSCSLVKQVGNPERERDHRTGVTADRKVPSTAAIVRGNDGLKGEGETAVHLAVSPPC